MIGSRTEAYHVLSADEGARWRALLEAPHRSLDAFLEAFRAGFAARDLPKCLRYRARADTRRDFLEALYEWSCLVRSRYVEVRWTPQAGLGLYAKQRLAASLDLSEVVGRLARISQKDEDWLAERGRNHSVVLRYFDQRADGTFARAERSVCVGPLSLINGACFNHCNVQPYLERAASGLKRQREATQWKAAQIRPGAVVEAGRELLTFYDHEYDVPCPVCTAEAPAPKRRRHYRHRV